MSEVAAVGIEPSALDCRVAPAGGASGVAEHLLVDHVGQVTYERCLLCLARDATENLYAQNAGYGEDPDPKCWQVRPVSRQSTMALASRMSYPPHAARTLDGLEGNLYWAIQTLEEKRRFVVGWFDASACHFSTHETLAATAQDGGQPSGLRIDAGVPGANNRPARSCRLHSVSLRSPTRRRRRITTDDSSPIGDR
ncbi:hypothetical protein [Virgisporangium ochraceum]|uniref:hypothetical protein n=1 Tax=Virgisporangium ochraceum TaxID=65505 RepID=UPI0019416AF2|nr:hypothetical protein [Virgisporangium ochraceum]